MAVVVNTQIHAVLSAAYTAKCKGKSVITKVPLDLSTLGLVQKIAFLLENVFSPEECKALIRESETIGYTPTLGDAAIQPSKYSYRDFYRLMVDDEKFSAILFARIGKFLPKKFGKNELLRINERFRFLRYKPGDKFKMHYDGHYTLPDGSARTFITLQIYLNDSPPEWGGATSFLAEKCSGNREGEERNRIFVYPKAGMVLVFEHRLLHEGSILMDGIKYTIRNDVLYNVRKANLDSDDSDSEAGGQCCIV